MKRKLRELFGDVYYALDELMYSKLIDCETFRKLDELVKTPLSEIIDELNKNEKIQILGNLVNKIS